MGTMKWQPPWWNEQHASAWERVREAMRRDWEQTKHDVHAPGGHELNQKLGDTVKQATGKEPIPADDRANPPKVVGELGWDEVEVPTEYGFAARDRFAGTYAGWTTDLERTLQREWESGGPATGRPWGSVRDHVKRGYEYPHTR
ncbi:MAG TPA: hypothetical protein VGG39_00715 [Polyangiaceae bacterium]|jgi:hypothetical protein